MKYAIIPANNRFNDLVRNVTTPIHFPDKGMYIPFGRDYEEIICRFNISTPMGCWLVRVDDEKKFLLFCIDYGLGVRFVCKD